MNQAWLAFEEYRSFSFKQRADFMRTIALEIERLEKC
jgi:Ni,Fe-hydrogenase III large subunit